MGMSIHQYQRYEYGESAIANCRMKIGLRICAVLELDPYEVVFENGKDMAGLEGRLSNPQFLSKAPENVVAGERDKLEKLTAKKAMILDSIGKLG